MTWGSIILALLKLADLVLNYAREKKLLQAGQDKEIARSSLEILRKTEEAKAINEYLSGLRGPDLDAVLTNLEGGRTD